MEAKEYPHNNETYGKMRRKRMRKRCIYMCGRVRVY